MSKKDKIENRKNKIDPRPEMFWLNQFRNFVLHKSVDFFKF